MKCKTKYQKICQGNIVMLQKSMLKCTSVVLLTMLPNTKVTLFADMFYSRISFPIEYLIGDELLHFGLENLFHGSFNKGKCVFVFCLFFCSFTSIINVLHVVLSALLLFSDYLYDQSSVSPK